MWSGLVWSGRCPVLKRGVDSPHHHPTNDTRQSPTHKGYAMEENVKEKKHGQHEKEQWRKSWK